MKISVIAATRHGSTLDVAQFIADRLTSGDFRDFAAIGEFADEIAAPLHELDSHNAETEAGAHPLVA